MRRQGTRKIFTQHTHRRARTPVKREPRPYKIISRYKWNNTHKSINQSIEYTYIAYGVKNGNSPLINSYRDTNKNTHKRKSYHTTKMSVPLRTCASTNIPIALATGATHRSLLCRRTYPQVSLQNEMCSMKAHWHGLQRKCMPPLVGP